MKKTYIINIVFVICALFGLTSCSSTLDTIDSWFAGDLPQEELVATSGGKLLLINTPYIKFYDLAIMRLKQDSLNIDLFSIGKPIGVIKITNTEICYEGECALKSLVAKKIFGPVSYGELFEDIFLGRDIFESKGFRISKDGLYIQNFVINNQEIYYERTRNYVLFKNKTNNIMISIQDYEPPKNK